MSIVEQLEAAGEVLSPAVREALIMLEARVRELEARLGLNSTNSSKPPSSDPPHLKRTKKRRSGRKRGGQKGHPGHRRELLPPERVDVVIDHRPDTCRRCGHSLADAPDVGAPGRHQVIELPPVRAHVSEHRTHSLACPNCGQWTKATLPAELGGKHFGPRLTAFAVRLVSTFRLSRRKLGDFLGELLDVEPPSLGTTQRFCDEASAALLDPYREARRAVRRSAVAYVDETGWTLRGETRWTWAAVTRRATLYRIGRSRSARERRRLLGRDFEGILGTDRWSAYASHPAERHQLCWAHLKRNFQALVDRGGASRPVGDRALAECERLFRAWRRHAEGELTHPQLARELAPLRARFARLLGRGAASEDRKARALCRNLQGRWISLWTFLRIEGVRPTSNPAERALRTPVIWRKLCFGSNSGKGLRFTERVLTVTETCTQHQQNVLEYLTRAIVAARENRPAPRLLPAR